MPDNPWQDVFPFYNTLNIWSLTTIKHLKCIHISKAYTRHKSTSKWGV